MPLNPNIILSGQQPDLVNTLGRSSQAAAITNANRRQNALADLYQQQGPGILSGDQGALNALAQHDPQAALQVQQVRRANRVSDQELALKVQQYKATLTSQQAAAEAAKIKQGVFAASGAQTPQEWDAIAQQFGATELVGQFESRDALLRQYMTAAQILEQGEPDAPLSAAGKLKADLDAGMITLEQFNAASQESGLRVTSDGEGGFTMEQGPGVTSSPSTSGTKTLDKETAKELSAFIQGGAADMAKNIAQLKGVRERISSGASGNVTGPIVGQLPDSVTALRNQEALDVREQVEEVVQRNLRAVLGAQFTQKEGDRLIARAFNPLLDEEMNLKRLDRLIRQIELAYETKSDAAEYFRENGTLSGWGGKLPTINDFQVTEDSSATRLKYNPETGEFE